MMYKLRDYQAEASGRAVMAFQNYSKPFLLVLATGAGKSIVIADICHKLDEPVLILQPNKEILEQNFAKLKSYGIDDIAVYSASLKSKEIAKYTYATIGSVYKKPELFSEFRHIIIDEAHEVNPQNSSGMYMKFFNGLAEIQGTPPTICGLTATPYRLVAKYFWEDGRQYYSNYLRMINRIHPFFFKNIEFKIETKDLIDQGYLSPIKYRVDKQINLAEIQLNKSGTNFDERALEQFWTGKGGWRLRRMAKIIQRIDKHCQRNLIFCSSVRQARIAQEMLAKLGIEAELVTGETPPELRASIIHRFKMGHFKHLLNVKVFTTGFDVPSLDCVTMAAPTKSLALYYQMVGRGVRLDPLRPHKVLRVYDLSGTVQSMGRVESIRIVKEGESHLDMVTSEVGQQTGVALFKYLVKKKKFNGRKK